MEVLNSKWTATLFVATLVLLSSLAALTVCDRSDATSYNEVWGAEQHDSRTLNVFEGDYVNLDFNGGSISSRQYTQFQVSNRPSWMDSANAGTAVTGDYTLNVHWSKENDNGSTLASADFTVRIIVSPLITHILEYHANGGSGAPATQSSTDQNSTAQFTVSNIIPTRSGFTFLGWSTDPNATSASYSGGNSISVGNGTVTLYAIWKVDINIANDTVLTGNTVFYTPVVEGTVTVSGADWLIANGNTIYGTAPSSPGSYEVTVSCGTSAETITITVVSALAPTNTPSNGAIVFVKG